MTFFIYDSLDSTNDLAMELAKNGAAHGTAVLARRQEKGRGQYLRQWHSPEGGMWLSVVLRKVPHDREALTVSLGNRIAEELELLTKQRFTIKPPNDILYNGRKLCGLLVELVTRGAETYGVVGVGINVNNKNFPHGLAECATSLILIDGAERDIIDIAKRITKRILEEKYVNCN